MDNFVRQDLPQVISISKLITVFYMELSKDFHFEGERHNFWEMVYIDKGEMLCTADNHQFTLKSGEVTFHKPNEFHNLSGDGKTAPNVSVLTFECDSAAMKHFEGKILQLNAEEKRLLSLLISEGLACFRLEDLNNPLLQTLQVQGDAPFGGFQMIRNLLEIFLISLYRHRECVTKASRQSIQIDGVAVNFEVKEILDVLQANIYGRLSVSDIAKAVDKSESTVKSVFRTFYSGGIMRYYSSLKIREAKILIRENRHTMAQIAELLCYDSPQYFSKCFRDATNMSPSQYRRSIIK